MSSPPTQSAKTTSSLQRLFDGWQAGLTVVVIALMVLAVAIPRPAVPEDVPLPIPNRTHLVQLARQQDRWAEQVASKPLSFDVRALGDALRRYGLADADGKTQDAQRMLVAIQMRREPALQHGGPEAILKLRAYQTRVFVTELDRYVATGNISKALREVGGGIVKNMLASGWIIEAQNHRTLVADHFALRAMFTKRWNALTGLKSKPFAPSLDEIRALFALLLRHPRLSPAQQRFTDPLPRCRAANLSLLRHIGQLGRLDPAYPTAYARGLVLLRMGHTKQAIPPLAYFVEHHPDGPYVLVARNTLRQAQQIAVEASK